MALAPSSDSFNPSNELGCNVLSDSASPSPQLSPRLSSSTNQASSSQKNTSTSHEAFLSAKFNQDYGCFCCGMETGFRIFNCDPFTETFRRECDGEGIGHVEMLFRSNILALVGGGKSPRYSPNKVMLWDDNQQRCIGELSFRSEVRAVRLRRDRIVVVLEYRIYVYNFSDLKLLHQIGTTSNTKGLCELSPATNACTIACLGQRKGEIRIELYTLKKTRLVQCHNSSIACITLSLDGTLLASASERGTLVRIFCTNDGTPLQELRRGAERAEIYSLAFSTNLQWLALSSDKGTVHVFCLLPSSRSSDLYPPNSDNPSDKSITLNNGLMMAGSALLSRASSNAGSSLSFIRGVLPKYFSSNWSFAQFRMPGETMSIVAFGPQKNTIIIVCANGSYYKCSFDPVQGGLMTQTEYGLYLESSENINHEKSG